jgi:GTP-binding protein LepA
LRLTDAALSFEPDANEALGRGFKAGFLGQLHFEITVSRLSREFGSEFITSFPSIAYRVKEKNTTRIIKDAHKFPSDPDEVFEPIIRVEILTPAEYLNQIVNMKNVFDIEIGEIKNIGEQMFIVAKMPLRELIRDFDDQLKSVSAGFASFSYELDGEARAEVEKLEILVIGEVVPALTRIVLKKDVGREARLTVERLKKLLSKEQWSQAIQASVRGRIIARETIPALRKDVTGYLYGGDRTRKMKLWKKQKRGKEKLERLVSIKGRAASNRKISLSAEIFREILKK